jgi:hypothetical protein
MRQMGIRFATCLCAAARTSVRDQDFRKVQMKVSKAAGKVYLIEGAGGNIGACDLTLAC